MCSARRNPEFPRLFNSMQNTGRAELTILHFKKSESDLPSFCFEKSQPKKILHGLYLKAGSKGFLSITVVYVYVQLVMRPAHNVSVSWLFGFKRKRGPDSHL